MNSTSKNCVVTAAPFRKPRSTKALCLSLTGHHRYWDWTLDWESFAQSPVFSTTAGFGGDGDPSLPETVGGGRCVTSGPLAGTLQPLFYGANKKPHCLSRGFNFSDMPLEALSPDAVEKALQADTYMQFLLDIENGPHNAVPNAVKGDFYSFTAPYGKAAHSFFFFFLSPKKGVQHIYADGK